MDLIDRKRIANSITGFEKIGPANFDSAANLKLENSMLKSGQFVTTNNGKLEPNMAAAGGKTSPSLNYAGIANTAMSAINFANTLGNVSKNNYSSDEMMGSGGTVQ